MALRYVGISVRFFRRSDILSPVIGLLAAVFNIHSHSSAAVKIVSAVVDINFCPR